jgi:hypothetical protein
MKKLMQRMKSGVSGIANAFCRFESLIRIRKRIETFLLNDNVNVDLE